jgi:hypothetical protein
LLPADHLLVELAYGATADERLVRISAFGPTALAALQRLVAHAGIA